LRLWVGLSEIATAAWRVSALPARQGGREPHVDQTVAFAESRTRRTRPCSPFRATMGDLGVARLEPTCAHPMGVVPVVVESRDAHAFARLSRVDELPVADVNPVVAKTVEENQVPGLQFISRYRCAIPVLPRGVVRQRDTDPTVDVADEARAVEAVWTSSAPAITSTDMF